MEEVREIREEGTLENLWVGNGEGIATWRGKGERKGDRGGEYDKTCAEERHVL